ncbi:uncharacterized protein TNCV_894531 [Trichonephila clavipes]|nr:uncharacterized protein TNCV_894531 [Trichonephila clavipes]
MASAVLADPDTTFCQSVTFHIDLAWHHCRRSCRCSGVKESARKGILDLRFASARCLEIVCGTIATPTSARIVERVTVGSPSACRTILRSSLLVVILIAPDLVFHAWVPSRVHCSQQFQTAHSERSTWPATRSGDQPAVFIPMVRPPSNSLNYSDDENEMNNAAPLSVPTSSDMRNVMKSIRSVLEAHFNASGQKSPGRQLTIDNSACLSERHFTSPTPAKRAYKTVQSLLLKKG